MSLGNGFARAQAAYDRQEPPDDGLDELMERWADTFNTDANRKALATTMAYRAMEAINGELAGKTDHLAEWIETWLQGDMHAVTDGEDPFDVVSAMVGQIDVPSFHDWLGRTDDDPRTEPEDRPGYDS